jgi:hypothetical protein
MVADLSLGNSDNDQRFPATELCRPRVAGERSPQTEHRFSATGRSARPRRDRPHGPSRPGGFDRSRAVGIRLVGITGQSLPALRA